MHLVSRQENLFSHNHARAGSRGSEHSEMSHQWVLMNTDLFDLILFSCLPLCWSGRVSYHTLWKRLLQSVLGDDDFKWTVCAMLQVKSHLDGLSSLRHTSKHHTSQQLSPSADHYWYVWQRKHLSREAEQHAEFTSRCCCLESRLSSGGHLERLRPPRSLVQLGCSPSVWWSDKLRVRCSSGERCWTFNEGEE